MQNTNTDRDIKALCDVVRETSFSIHRYLRHGYAELIYQNALLHRLNKLGVTAVKEHPLTVFDEDLTVLGEFRVDLLVENELLVELKAVRALADEHIAQILGYLRASRKEHGLLINFGASRLEIRKYILSHPAFEAVSDQ